MKLVIVIAVVAIIIINILGFYYIQTYNIPVTQPTQPLYITYELKSVITVNKDTIYENETIYFSGINSKGKIKNYFWRFYFEEEYNNLGPNTSFKYTECGIYTVYLKVIDIYGNTSTSSYKYIYVNYKTSHSGEVSLDKNESYYIDKNKLKTDVMKCHIIITYPRYPSDEKLLNTNDLNFYVYFNDSDDSEIAKNENALNPKASSTITDELWLNRYETKFLVVNEKPRIKVVCNKTAPGGTITYTLQVHLYYSS